MLKDIKLSNITKGSVNSDIRSIFPLNSVDHRTVRRFDKTKGVIHTAPTNIGCVYNTNCMTTVLLITTNEA